MGRFALPDCIRDHAGFPGVWAAGDHRRLSDLILDSGSVAAAADVEITQPEAGALFRLGAGRSISFKVFVGTVVLRIPGSRLEHETSPAAGAAN